MSHHRKTFLTLIICTTMLILSPEAWGQTVVTACGTDTATGGVNLKTALAKGGPIVIRCATGSSTILITQVHVVHRTTSLDGGGRVTLDGNNRTSMFIVSDPRIHLTLSNLTVTRGQLSLGRIELGILGPLGGIVTSRGHVELKNVRTRRSVNPYDVGSLVASENSVFDGNRGKFVIRATRADIMDSQISNNQGVPLTYPLHRQERPRAFLERVKVFGNLRPLHWFGDLTVVSSRFTNNAGGALHVLDGVVDIKRSHFTNNRAANGGAIYISGGNLKVERTNFEGNSAERRGGAIRIHSGSTGEIEATIRHSKFRNNRATLDGGALDLEGHLQAVAVLFYGNSSSKLGGALHMPRGRAELSRSVFVNNQALIAGGGISSGASGFDRVQLGNALIVRNTSPGGGGFSGRTLELFNSSIIGNQGGGLVIVSLPRGYSGPAGGLSMANTIVARNAGGNCVMPNGFLKDAGHNLQFPGNDCGEGMKQVDPFLDTMYVPSPGSPARFSGDSVVCRENLLVQSLDVYGSQRPTHEVCTIGAVEHDLEHHAIRLLAPQRKLPDRVREFFEFIHVLRRSHTS